jgi:hypothetical protein
MTTWTQWAQAIDMVNFRSSGAQRSGYVRALLALTERMLHEVGLTCALPPCVVPGARGATS